MLGEAMSDGGVGNTKRQVGGVQMNQVEVDHHVASLVSQSHSLFFRPSPSPSITTMAAAQPHDTGDDAEPSAPRPILKLSADVVNQIAAAEVRCSLLQLTRQPG